MLNVHLYSSFIIKEFLISQVLCCSVCVYLQHLFYEIGWTFWNDWLVVGSPWCWVTAFQLQITLLDFMKCEIYIVSLVLTQHSGYLSFWGGRSEPLTGIALLSLIPTGYNSFTAFIPVGSLVIASSFVCCGTRSWASSIIGMNTSRFSAQEVYQIYFGP